MRRIPILDGWRAVAIALVIAHHAVQNCTVSEAAYALDDFGQFGVDIFFGLSGLLITRLLLEEHTATGSFNLPQFYIRRTFRILPPLLAFVAVHTILGLWKSNLELVSSLLFFRNYASVHVTGFTSIHLWSLAVEEHFYLLWPGLLAFSGPRRAKSLAIGLAVSVAVWRMLAHQIAPWPFPGVALHLRTDLRLDALLWGCVAACVLHGMKQRESLARQVQYSEWILITAVLVTIVRFRTPTATTLVALLVPLMLIGTLLHPEWRISKVLAWGGFTWIGRISYSLYLWQQLFLIPGWQRTSLWHHWPLNLVAALGTATLSYYLLEKPLIRLGRRLSQSYSRNRPGYSAFTNTTAIPQTAR